MIPDVDIAPGSSSGAAQVGEVPARAAVADRRFTKPAALAQVALAARSSASFPVAFEPSYCPVESPTDPPDHPDMNEPANFASRAG